jgi:NitT/TauT family transport system substrate-binding protein
MVGSARSVKCLVMALLLWAGAAGTPLAAEPLHISGLTWPGYGFWFIAKEKG